jgi:cysteinyl-tRNA synthetase
MHLGMVETATDEKMAKSVGNIFLLGEAIAAYGAEAVVGFLVSGHPRQPIRFSAEALAQAQARNERIRDFFRSGSDPDGEGEDEFVAARCEAFLAALADDFNTPRAIAELFDLIAEANRRPLVGARAVATELVGLLGLESLATAGEAADAGAERLLDQRQRARAERDFERADQIRAELAALGWEVRDTAEGARLVRRD